MALIIQASTAVSMRPPRGSWLLPQSPLTCVFPLLILPPLLPSVAATCEFMFSPYGSGGRPLHSFSVS